LRLTAWLNAQEVGHRFVVYPSDAKATAWTRRCVRQADRILLVVDSEDPGARRVETDLLGSWTTRTADGCRNRPRASLSLPGILPPVVYGNDLHVDGGTFDNLPVGKLRDLGAGRVIGSDLEFGGGYTLNYDRFPSTWSLVKDPYIFRRRRLKVPSAITTVFRSAILTSLRKNEEVLVQIDLALCPPVQGVGLTQWSALDRLVEIGYRHTRERLEAGGPELRARLGAKALENR